jgi:hypothetical protein
MIGTSRGVRAVAHPPACSRPIIDALHPSHFAGRGVIIDGGGSSASNTHPFHIGVVNMFEGPMYYIIVVVLLLAAIGGLVYLKKRGG